MTKQSILPTVYIVANRKNGALYTGVTSDLAGRIYQHKQGEIKGFTAKYGCKSLVFYEVHSTMENAILREKQIKGGSRRSKVELINQSNPDWKDLYGTIL